MFRHSGAHSGPTCVVNQTNTVIVHRLVHCNPLGQLPREVAANARANHQTLCQRVGSQPVRAVHTRVGNLTHRKQTVHFGGAVQVRNDATAGVVSSGRNGNAIGSWVDARGQTRLGDKRKAFGKVLTDRCCV